MHMPCASQSAFATLCGFLLLGLPCAALGAQSSKPVLGIPFGETLVMKICPFNTDKTKAACWIAKPFVHKPTGAKLGSIHLPNPNSRPEWAAYAAFEVTLDREDKVQEIKVHPIGEPDRYEIAKSISLRFGAPREDQLRRSDVSWASWKTDEGNVEMRCQRECWIEFRTPSAQSARDVEKRARDKSNAERPKAP
jgi:hypothetical protein